MISQDVAGDPSTVREQLRPVIIASNRGPVWLNRAVDGGWEIQRSSGGLVTALTGLAHHIDATWISCAQSQDDAEWREGDIELEESDRSLHVIFLNPEELAYEGYYNVIANPLLWFLQHSMWDLPRAPVINRDTWQAWDQGYIAVNRLFAQEIAAQIKGNPARSLVMLQDYHLYLAPRLIREFAPKRKPTILHFIHIPWPGPEYWGVLPPAMRQSILTGLCAVDLLGFQTREDGLNFIRTCENYLPRANVNFKRGRIWYRQHATHVRDFPISIDVQALRVFASSPEVEAHQPEVLNIIGDRKLVLRVDRIEPSKNIIRGFQAFEEMLDLHPEHQGEVVFLALLVPSRLGVEEYQHYLDELMAAAGRVNARFGNSDWEPVRLLVSESYPRAIAALRLYDVLLVNSIADGMNLVAKEGPMVNQRAGVLILSERTGAQQQLESGATVISPFDVYATAEAMHQGLVMPAEEKRARANRLVWLIEREDINAWLSGQLDALKELSL
jgi:trehalose 6-phosphate synthase